MLRPLLPLILLGAGCSSVTVRPRAAEVERPEALVRRLRRALAKDDWRRLYDQLSDRTQNELGTTKFRLFFPKLGIPGTELELLQVLREGELQSFQPYSPDAEARRQRRASGAPPRRHLMTFAAEDRTDIKLVQLLIVREGPGGGRWRLAMQEQSDAGLPLLIGSRPKREGG